MHITQAFAFLVLLLIGCRDNKIKEGALPAKEEEITVHIKLTDDLGSISMQLPSRYDTFFTWTDRSDCGKPCDKTRYRYQNKRARVIKESGWIKTDDRLDSTDRFTVTHSADIRINDSSSDSFIRRYHQHRKQELLQDPAFKVISSDTIMNIQGHPFSVFFIDRYDSSARLFEKRVLAAASVRGNMVEFSFEFLRPRQNELMERFPERSIYYLRTIQINK